MDMIEQHTNDEPDEERRRPSTSLLEAAMHTPAPVMPHRILPDEAGTSSEHSDLYASARRHLVTRICAEIHDATHLLDRPWTPCGPFAILYDMRNGNDASTPVTHEHLRAWGVSCAQLHTDALEAERAPLVWKPPEKGPRPHFALADHQDSDPQT